MFKKCNNINSRTTDHSLLKLDLLYNFACLVRACRYTLCDCYDHFSDRFVSLTLDHPFMTRSNLNISPRTPHVVSSISYKSFVYNVITLSNDIPLRFKADTPLNKLKKISECNTSSD